MNSREYFAQTIANEGPAFGRVLQALPQDKLDYRPHPKSRSAHELAAQLGFTPNALLQLIEIGKITDPHMSALPTMEAIQQAGKSGHEALVKGLESVDDKTWNDKKVQFLLPDGTVAWEATLRDMSWTLLHDAIHHRGQLSSYIRPMGGKVPSIYGPSGDDQGGM